MSNLSKITRKGKEERTKKHDEVGDGKLSSVQNGADGLLPEIGPERGDGRGRGGRAVL